MPNIAEALDRLQHHDPARSLPALSNAERDAIRERIVMAQPSHPAARRSQRRAQRRRRMTLAAGLAVIALAVAGVLGLHTAAAPQPALAAQMSTLAQLAVGQSWAGVPGTGQYLYTRSWACNYNDVVDSQIWIAADGSGAFDEGPLPSQASALCGAHRGSGNYSENNFRFPVGGLNSEANDWGGDWHNLSTDPATLLTQLRTLYGGPQTAAEDFGLIGDLMSESDAPPVIREALYNAAALIPGVKLMAQQTDPTGQTGLGVGFYSGDTVQSELIFNQQTGRLLAEETYDPAGNLTDWTAYLEQKIVSADTIPDLPMNPTSPQGGIAVPDSSH